MNLIILINDDQIHFGVDFMLVRTLINDVYIYFSVKKKIRKKISKIILEAMLFDQNFTHFQTMKIRKENFVTIRADCQLCLIFYLILGFYFRD
jgi:S-adenosylmethionine synthetase